MSRPSRARGLKLKRQPNNVIGSGVAPLAGAWIETKQSILYTSEIGVAPLAGAWIETTAALLMIIYSGPSRPSRARGLKQELQQ